MSSHTASSLATEAASTPAVEADRVLKEAHRRVWASGDYPTLASELVWGLGPVLVEAIGMGRGDKVLDVAAGTGNASIPAARTGADVVAADLTPELLEAGRTRADAAGVSIQWRVADAERMPDGTGEHDVVMSCIGVMFAPHHQRAADELLRVLRPGGRLGLLSWTPEGVVGQMFAAMRPFAPAPPVGSSPPPLWGSVEHVTELLGEGVDDIQTQIRTIRVDAFDSGSAFRDYFKTHYGPTIAVYRHLGDDAERVAALDDALAGVADRSGVTTGTFDWEYLLLTARRR